ncbi:hypothetical protein QNM99_20505 [Pseudomonas sp. PCH446]
MNRSPAFERATELALSSGAALHILAFDYVPTLDMATLFDQKAMTQAREGYLDLHRRWLRQETDHLRAGPGCKLQYFLAPSSVASDP